MHSLGFLDNKTECMVALAKGEPKLQIRDIKIKH